MARNGAGIPVGTGLWRALPGGQVDVHQAETLGEAVRDQATEKR